MLWRPFQLLAVLDSSQFIPFECAKYIAWLGARYGVSFWLFGWLDSAINIYLSCPIDWWKNYGCSNDIHWVATFQRSWSISRWKETHPFYLNGPQLLLSCFLSKARYALERTHQGLCLCICLTPIGPELIEQQLSQDCLLFDFVKFSGIFGHTPLYEYHFFSCSKTSSKQLLSSSTIPALLHKNQAGIDCMATIWSGLIF